jgi:queuine tRNA-ribosyltransferase
MPLKLEISHRDGLARSGRVVTPRGSFQTPCFMPVGTRGAIVHLDASEYAELGAEVVLGNTYHLMLKPGAQAIADLGGLHEFTTWDGHMLTDSGGFQVMSLDPKVDDDGVTFRSVYDGSTLRFTPEDAVRTQELLAADIQMVLDVCAPLPSSDAVVRKAMMRTHSWAARAQRAHTREDQALFGIVQGGIDTEMRIESASVLSDLEFPGYGIGGLSVGETRAEMIPALAAAVTHLPDEKPRYLMGVGDPASLVEAVLQGVDMFDCVLPTRLARHGSVLTGRGNLNIRNLEFASDTGPLDEECGCSVCARFSRAYIRHLIRVKEPTGGRLVTIHNLWWLLDLVRQMREAIELGQMVVMRDRVMRVWG